MNYVNFLMKLEKNGAYFSGRKVALLCAVLQFRPKACQTGAPVEKVTKMARRESRRRLDEHQK